MLTRLDSRFDISPSDIEDIRHSVPDWDALVGNPGYVRHDVRSAEGNYPASSKVSYDVHAEPELSRGVQDLTCIGARDSGQNLLKPAYSGTREQPLLCRPDEPVRSATYTGFVRWEDGQIGIRRLRFTVDTPVPEVRFIDEESPTDAAVEFVICGQALLAGGRVTALETLAAQSYDLRHVWHLPWEESDDNSQAARAHERLMSLFMRHIESDERTRGAVLCYEADRLKLSIQSGYLMSGLGTRPDGGLILVVRHGTMQDLARALREEGATDGILLDEGGSCGVRVWSRGTARDVGGGTYFRPSGHSTLVITLRQAYVDAPFRRTPTIDWPGLARPIRLGTTYLDSADDALRLHTSEALTVTFDDPYGLRRRELPYDSRHPRGSAAILAAHILAHVMLAGSRQVSIDASGPIVDAVRREFASRFDRLEPGAGLASGSATDHLTDFTGTPFTISGEPILDTTDHEAEPRRSMTEGHVIGLDVGSGQTKGVLSYIGPDGSVEDLANGTVPTRPDDKTMTTGTLLEALKLLVEELVDDSGVKLTEVVALGVTWPGAVWKNRICVPSNLLRECVDLWEGDALSVGGFDAVARLADVVARDMPEAKTRLLNDGVALGSLAISRSGVRRCLFIGAGTSLASPRRDDALPSPSNDSRRPGMVDLEASASSIVFPIPHRIVARLSRSLKSLSPVDDAHVEMEGTNGRDRAWANRGRDQDRDEGNRV